MAEIKHSQVDRHPGVSLSTKKVTVGEQLHASLSTKRVHTEKLDKSVIVLDDHSKLKNLDYLSSGHTGFAGIEFGTTAEWNAKVGYRPPAGMIIVYTDYHSEEDPETGKVIEYAGIKIGDGNAYLVDKPFLGEEELHRLDEHINDMVAHITAEERQTWNNKLNYVEPEGDLLEFTRD